MNDPILERAIACRNFITTSPLAKDANLEELLPGLDEVIAELKQQETRGKGFKPRGKKK